MDFKKNNQLFFDLKSDVKKRAPLPYADKEYENKLKEAGFSFLGRCLDLYQQGLINKLNQK